MYKYFFVDKATNTPADALLAFGLARLLVEIVGEEEGRSLTIRDAGDHFAVTLKEPISDDCIAIDFVPLMYGLDTSKKQADLPPSFCIDYVMHQQRNDAYFKAIKAKFDEEQLREQGLTPPVLDWHAWAIINQMSAVDTYNKLNEQWYAHRDCFPALLNIILKLFSTRPNPVYAAERDWKALAKANSLPGSVSISQLQVVNPGMGKGGNRSKANGLSIGGLKGFWILEYLKYVGFYHAAVPRVVKDDEDRKTYILNPKDIEWNTHKEVFTDFQRTLLPHSAVHMDVLATLRYCEVFLQRWKAGQGQKWARFARGGRPNDYISAIDVVYYKYMGSAHATLNIGTMVLPEWLPEVKTVEQADQYLELIREHHRVVRGLNHENSEEYELLRKYRDFLSSRNLELFFQFIRGYSHTLMGKINAKAQFFPPQFTIPNLEVLIMSHDVQLKSIVQNNGFLKIAEAIRRSTIIPQYQKARGRDNLYEIRYGLGDKLLRRAQYATEFIQELSRFVHDYNNENARKSETRKQQYRKNITIQDLDDVIALIDQFGAATVAHLLVAYGYARDPRQEDESEIEQDAGAESDESLESIEKM